MSTLAVYNLTDEDMLRFANQVKEITIASLRDAGALEFDDTEEYERFCASFVVVVSQPGMFGRLWDKVFRAEDRSIVTVLRSTLPATGSPVLTLLRSE